MTQDINVTVQNMSLKHLSNGLLLKSRALTIKTEQEQIIGSQKVSSHYHTLAMLGDWRIFGYN